MHCSGAAGAVSPPTQFYHYHFPEKLSHLFIFLGACLLFSCSVMSHSETTWTVALQAPLSMGFSGQEYWSGFLFPSPGDLPNPGTERESPDK